MIDGIELDTKILDQITKEMEQEADEIVGEIAFDVETDAKRLAPVRFGFLRNSIHTLQLKKMAWRVQDGVEYGVFQELGTSRMKAQPFFTPAIERIKKTVDARFKRLFDK